MVVVSSHNQVKIIQRFSEFRTDTGACWHLDGGGSTKSEVVSRFKRHRGWAALFAAVDVSEGHSFDAKQVECTILAKLPLLWPKRDLMFEARSELIPGYALWRWVCGCLRW